MRSICSTAQQLVVGELGQLTDDGAVLLEDLELGGHARARAGRAGAGRPRSGERSERQEPRLLESGAGGQEPRGVGAVRER